MIKKAYSLLEAIVAISVVTVIITASVTVINSSLQSLDENGSNLMAYNFVQEGLGYFERMVKTNKLRFPGRGECKFVPLSLPNCNSEVEGGVLQDGFYDLSFDARDDVMDYTIIESEGSLNNNDEAGNQFDNNKLNSYKKCTNDREVARGELDDEESCVYFYSADGKFLEEGDVSSVGTTKFVRVIEIENEGNNVTSSVYFFVVGKAELQKIELSTNL